MRARTLLLLPLSMYLIACDEPAQEQAHHPTDEAADPSAPPPAEPIPESWVRERAEAARERLGGDEAGRLVLAAIEAHGGLERWLSHGTIEFEFDYRPVDEPERRMHTLNQVDLWRSRAHQREIEEEGSDDPAAELGWDGEVAWITPGPDAFPTPARFWATTPYYFVGIPFVLADAGARYERMEDAELDGVTHRLVRVSYEPGTGDSPDDYYVIYVHPETSRVAAIRYVVAYPGFFPEGGHSPEKLMRYEDLREVDGLWLAHRFRTHRWDAETESIGEVMTEIDASGHRFGQRWPASHFEPPEGATVQEEIEPRR